MDEFNIIVENEEPIDVTADIQNDFVKGDKGDKGDSAFSVKIGQVITGEPGTDASVNNSGTKEDLILDFIIPEGKKGEVSLEQLNVVENKTIVNAEKIKKLEEVDIYSTEKKVVGKWINGKPLYEKTIVDTGATVVTNGTAVTKYITIDSEVEISFIKEGYFVMSNGTTRQPMPVFFTTSDPSKFCRAYTNSNDLVLQSNSLSYSELEFCAVVRYTKTTD